MDFTVVRMCRLLEVSRSGFDKWRHTQAAGTIPAQKRRAALDIAVAGFHAASDGVNGAPRGAAAIPDLLKLRFDSGTLNTVWTSDITYLRTGEGWLLTVSGDPRTPEVDAWLALPGHGGSGEAMANRLEGRLVEQIRSDAYTPPLKLPQLSYVIGRLRELSVMWAFGGSASWPRDRIDADIAAVRNQVADFLAPAS